MTVTGADKENAGFSERIRTQINPPHAPFASVKVARISRRWGGWGGEVFRSEDVTGRSWEMCCRNQPEEADRN